MAKAEKFKETIESILKNYRKTTLRDRWEEGLAFEPDIVPIDYWVIELKDITNVVWLATNAVIDITWYSGDGQSTLNVLKYSEVVGVEIREGEGLAKDVNLAFEANYVVTVHATAAKGGLYWIARSKGDINKLGNFTKVFLRVLAER